MGGRTTTDEDEEDDDDDDDVEKATTALEGKDEDDEEDDAVVACGEGSSGGRTRPMIVVPRAAALWRVGRRRDTMVNGDSIKKGNDTSVSRYFSRYSYIGVLGSCFHVYLNSRERCNDNEDDERRLFGIVDSSIKPPSFTPQ
jgi:hypothetical protein